MNKKFFKLKILNSEILYIFILLFMPFILNIFSALTVHSSENTIGVIMPGDAHYYKDMHNAFISRLNKEGYGTSVKIVIQKPYPDHISMRNAVRRLIAMDVDIIVAYGAAAALAAIDERLKIPIVYAGVYEPLIRDVRAKNITGVSMKVPVSSLLRYLNEIKTNYTLGVAYCMFEEDSVYQLKEVIQLSEQYKFKVETINIQSPYDIMKLSEQFLGKSLGAILITSSSNVNSVSSAIIDISINKKIPTASMLPGDKNWPTIALFNEPKEIGTRAAIKAINIMNGIPPYQVGRETFTNTYLVFNLKEATKMGLKIPINLMTEASRLIE